MNIRPLGPDGISQRIRQIESRMAEVFGDKLQEAEGSTMQHSETTTRSQIRGSLPGNLAPFDGLGAPDALGSIADQIADEHGLDAGLFRALISAESGWNPRAVSSKGASGLAQLMPETARGLGVTDIFDPIQNMRGGAKYLRQMLDQFGSADLALAAYNAGPGAVRRYGGVPPFAETQNYVRKILGDQR